MNGRLSQSYHFRRRTGGLRDDSTLLFREVDPDKVGAGGQADRGWSTSATQTRSLGIEAVEGRRSRVELATKDEDILRIHITGRSLA
jgi:hypothetical protein